MCLPSRLVRGVKEDVVYGDIKIPKGSAIAIPVYLLHHDSEHYPDPEEFRPER